MLIFPRLVYKGPTVHLLVHGMAEYEAALGDGWNGCASEPVKAELSAMIDAMQSLKGESVDDVQEYMRQKAVAAGLLPTKEDPADDAPPTRAEMIAQAEKLGIDVDKRWGDKRLMAEIDKAAGG